jgi:hypothetical protein
MQSNNTVVILSHHLTFVFRFIPVMTRENAKTSVVSNLAHIARHVCEVNDQDATDLAPHMCHVLEKVSVCCLLLMSAIRRADCCTGNGDVAVPKEGQCQICGCDEDHPLSAIFR